ncbi:transcriptional regulator, AlpA family [Nitrosomonas nitrosa]|uniref:Transcriptional regulator, AlpA family n=1 Tax=Nitrosomonas nitrosa TaxID=52442 RepID=A0A1I4R583_9PROT|nr:AlpA family phage regulatory protein [Nitrosomonas nitrosa]SFM47315.1 transcriptional regulator, AlpA family [Nitrosomonas nitrosa]
MKIQRLEKVIEQLGKKKSSIYRDVREGLLTRPVAIGARAVGWPSDEIDVIVSARIAGQTEGEIKSLVTDLMEKRKTFKKEAA